MKENIFDIKKLLLIRKVYSKYISEQSKYSSLSPAFAVFLSALNEHEFKSQQELSEFVGCNKAHTSRMLIKMQLKGLVKPCTKTIMLTEKGKEYAQKFNSYRTNFVKILLKNVSKEDDEIFTKVLNQIFENAKALA